MSLGHLRLRCRRYETGIAQRTRRGLLSVRATLSLGASTTRLLHRRVMSASRCKQPPHRALLQRVGWLLAQCPWRWPLSRSPPACFSTPQGSRTPDVAALRCPKQRSAHVQSRRRALPPPRNSHAGAYASTPRPVTVRFVRDSHASRPIALERLHVHYMLHYISDPYSTIFMSYDLCGTLPVKIYT